MAPTRGSRAKRVFLASAKVKRCSSRTTTVTSPLSSINSTPSMSSRMSSPSTDFDSLDVDDVVPSRTFRSIRNRSFRIQKADPRKSKSFSSGKKWSEEEDQVLCDLGGKGETFDIISERLPGRSEGACKARYCDVLGGANWLEHEEQTIISLVQAGATFPQISDHLRSRTPTQCRYRWELLKARAKSTLSKQDYSLFVSREAGYLDAHAEPAAKNDTGKTKPRSVWTRNEIATLLSLHARGKTWEQFSKRLRGRTPGACKSYLRTWYPLADSRVVVRSRSQPTITNVTPIQRRSARDQVQDETPDRITGQGPWAESSQAPFKYNVEKGPEYSLNVNIISDEEEDDDPSLNKDHIDNDKEKEALDSYRGSRSQKTKPKSMSKVGWTEHEVRKLLSLYADGKTWAQISQCLPGRTPGACESRFLILRRANDQTAKARTQRTSKPVPAVENSSSRSQQLDGQGPPMFSGLPYGAEVPKVDFMHGASQQTWESRGFFISEDGDQSDYVSARVAKATHEEDDPDSSDDDKSHISISSDDSNSVIYVSSAPTSRNNTNASVTTYSPQPHAIPETELVPFARRVLHTHLVAQGEEKRRRAALETQKRHQALEQLRLLHPPQARHGGPSPLKTPTVSPLTPEFARPRSGIAAKSGSTTSRNVGQHPLAEGRGQSTNPAKDALTHRTPQLPLSNPEYQSLRSLSPGGTDRNALHRGAFYEGLIGTWQGSTSKEDDANSHPPDDQSEHQSPNPRWCTPCNAYEQALHKNSSDEGLNDTWQQQESVMSGDHTGILPTPSINLGPPSPNPSPSPRSSIPHSQHEGMLYRNPFVEGLHSAARERESAMSDANNGERIDEVKAQGDALEGHLQAMEEVAGMGGRGHIGDESDEWVTEESEGEVDDGEEDIEGVYRRWGIR